MVGAARFELTTPKSVQAPIIRSFVPPSNHSRLDFSDADFNTLSVRCSSRSSYQRCRHYSGERLVQKFRKPVGSGTPSFRARVHGRGQFTIHDIKLKTLLRKEQECTTDAERDRIGELLQRFTTGECANYFRNSGYASVRVGKVLVLKGTWSADASSMRGSVLSGSGAAFGYAAKLPTSPRRNPLSSQVSSPAA